MSISVARWYQELKAKKVVFIGIGVSHTRLIEKFLEKGINVTVCDKRSPEELGEDFHRLSSLGAKFCLGPDYLNALEEGDVIFRTPGMYYLSPALQEARRKRKIVTSEMECFCMLCPCKLYAITGSDGKTTTSTLIAEMLKAQGKQVHLGGNIGKALLPEIENIHPEDAAVVELSSFQLLSMRCAPDVAVVKNVTPNHLDVHKDMEEYTGAKKNVFLHQDAFSRTVLNLDDPVTKGFASEARGELSWFSMKEPPDFGTFLDKEGYLCTARFGRITRLFHKDEIFIRGMHNVENFLTAIAAVEGEVEPEIIRAVAKTFGGVEHRIEFVRKLDGVEWYNDSIASSPTRTIAGLDSFDRKIILIAGGYDKKIPYGPLAPKLVEKVKTLILMGATGPKIEEALKAFPGFSGSEMTLLHAASMEEAVEIAWKTAVEGDIVSLSPASASFDLYRNFEERGRHFKKLVQKLDKKETKDENNGIL